MNLILQLFDEPLEQSFSL